MLFEISDKRGKIIRLTDTCWKHITEEHPDVSIEEMQRTLENPTKITESKYDSKVLWYYQYDKVLKEYLMVSVKYLNGDAFIITAFYTRKLQ